MIPSDKQERIIYKQRVKAHCMGIIQMRIDLATQAMNQAQEAANSEEKSSAGDKYETSRAMNQIERDNYAHQLSVAIEDMNLLQTIDSDKLYEQADNGSVICSADTIYFIASGMGIIQFEGDKVIVLSPKAPLAQMLRGKSKGDQVSLNGKDFTINDIF